MAAEGEGDNWNKGEREYGSSSRNIPSLYSHLGMGLEKTTMSLAL